jgi:DNA-binding IclR family transcriptional regulator
VGPAAIALGLVGLRTVDAVRCASSLLPRLRDEIDETALLALWTSAGPVLVRLEESSRPVFMNIRVGSVLPLLPTATGRVFAAFLPPERTQPLLETEHARAVAGNPLYAPGAAERLLTEARDQGFAAVSGDMIPGVNAMAAPILDHKGRIAAVIGALGRTEELDVSPEGRAAAALKRTAGEISRRLGYSVAAE